MVMRLVARLACVFSAAAGLVAPPALSSRRGRGALAAPITAPISEKLQEVAEPAARALAASYEAAELATSRTAYVRTSATSGPALVLVHGFDSSAMEFRRLLPELEEAGVRAFAYDVVGWGLSEPRAGVTVEAKRRQLAEFVKDVVEGDAILVGASLGAAVCVDALTSAAEDLDAVSGVALLDPQCMIDGAPPVPDFAARLGVRVLRSWPLRALANRIAYFDKSLGTEDAIRVGLLHCERPGWEDDAVAWVNGGGYSVSAKVRPALSERRALVLWGDNDEILPPGDNVPKFAEALKPGDPLRFVTDCGHVPHLEQPAVTAKLLAAFASGEDADLARTPGTTDARGGGGGANADAFDWTDVSKEPLGDDRAAYRVAKIANAREQDVVVRFDAPITIAGILFFVPLFLGDTFFAISRSFICTSKDLALADLCRPPVSL